jgi:hypothetical protein
MMRRIFSCGLAAIAATWLTPSVYAGGGGGVGGSFGSGASGSSSGGHASGGSGFHSGPVAHFSSSGGGGHYDHTSNFATHSGAGASAVPSVHHASTAAAPAMAHASTAAAPTVNVNRAFAPAQTRDPTVAFGGSTTALRGGGRAFSPSRDVTQNWDRNRSHAWNHHRYRYFNGGWIYWGDGFPYDDFANTDNDHSPYPPYPYPSPVNGVMDNGQPSANGSAGNDSANNDPPSANKPPASDGSDYGTPDTLIVNVQDALTHRGYATGSSNGTFGPMTETALSNFQRDQKLPVTGRIDGMTLKALGLL